MNPAGPGEGGDSLNLPYKILRLPHLPPSPGTPLRTLQPEAPHPEEPDFELEIAGFMDPMDPME